MVVAADGGTVSVGQSIAGFALGYLLLAGTDTINDVTDFETDLISKPWRPLPSGRVEPRLAIIVGGIEIAGALAIAASLSVGTLAFSAIAGAVGIAYSWYFKNVFIVKNVVVAATLMLPFAAGGATTIDEWPSLMWFLFPMVFLATLAFEVHKDVLDLEADRSRGRRTLANTLPAGQLLWIIGGCYAGAYAIAWRLASIEPLGVLYRWALIAVGALLLLGLGLLRLGHDQTSSRLRASFLATNAAFLLALLGIGIEAIAV